MNTPIVYYLSSIHDWAGQCGCVPLPRAGQWAATPRVCRTIRARSAPAAAQCSGQSPIAVTNVCVAMNCHHIPSRDEAPDITCFLELSSYFYNCAACCIKLTNTQYILVCRLIVRKYFIVPTVPSATLLIQWYSCMYCSAVSSTLCVVSMLSVNIKFNSTSHSWLVSITWAVCQYQYSEGCSRMSNRRSPRVWCECASRMRMFVKSCRAECWSARPRAKISLLAYFTMPILERTT